MVGPPRTAWEGGRGKVQLEAAGKVHQENPALMQDITQGQVSPGWIPSESRVWARWTHTMLVLYYPKA